MTTATTGSKMSLSAVSIGGGVVPPRCMMYGADGVGKSTFWSQAPDPIFVCTEEGASRIQVAQFPLCKTWEDMMECLRVLVREDHDYKTLVLDSADWAQELASQHVIDRDFDGSAAAFQDYGRGYRPLMSEWVKLLSALDYVRHAKGMEIVLIAHAVASDFKNPDGADFKVWKSNLLDSEKLSIWAKTKEWVDLLLFVNYRILVRQTRNEKAAGAGKGVLAQDERSRVIYAAPSASYATKVRAGWSLPDVLPLDQAFFRRCLNGQPANEPSSPPATEVQPDSKSGTNGKTKAGTQKGAA